MESLTLEAVIYKANKSRRDGDTPNFREAMMGPHVNQFNDHAMDQEIGQHEDHEDYETWTTVGQSAVPEEVKGLMVTRVFKVKRYTDGKIRKFKAHYHGEGDMLIESVDVFAKYSPIVSWYTVRSLMVFALQHNLAMRQVYFSNCLRGRVRQT